MHPRIKLKNVLCWGDLKASLRIAAKKSIHKTSSTAESRNNICRRKLHENFTKKLLNFFPNKPLSNYIYIRHH